MSITSDRIREVGFIHALADDAADEIEQLERDIVELKEARERESERLDWLLAKLGDRSLHLLVGEFSTDLGYWRDKIDKTINHHKR